MRYIYFSLIFLCFAASIFSNEKPMTIQSEEMKYNGKELILMGSVSIEHELGKISAKKIHLIPDQFGIKMKINTLTMEDEVKISLTNGGELRSASAVLDYSALTGVFSSPNPQDFVEFAEQKIDKVGNPITFQLKSKEMTIGLCKDASMGTSFGCFVSTIHASEEVSLNYNETFFAYVDSAVYQRDSEANQKELQLPGTVFLKNKTSPRPCLVTSFWGDKIEAQSISFDTFKRQIIFLHPNGKVKLNHSQQQSQAVDEIDFTCNLMTWSEPEHKLILNEDITIHHPSFGHVQNDGKIAFFYTTNQLNIIEALGKTTLAYVDADGNKHDLICKGTVKIDHKNALISLQKNSDESSTQIFFKDALGEIYADAVVINYQQNEGKLVPEKITLEGHVRILNQLENTEKSNQSFLEYALADKVEYTPEAKEVNLSSKGNGRVLFYDKVNHLQVSAPALKIRRDSLSNKETIQGIGDVRFSFVEKELAKMHHYFENQLSQDTKNEETYEQPKN